MHSYSKLNHLFKLLTNILNSVNTQVLVHETHDLAIHGMLHLQEQHHVFNHVYELITKQHHEWEVEHDHIKEEIRFKVVKSNSICDLTCLQGSCDRFTEYNCGHDIHKDEIIHLILTQNSLHLETHHLVQQSSKKKKKLKHRKTMIKDKHYLNEFIQYLSKIRNLKEFINGINSLLRPDFQWFCSDTQFKNIYSIHLENVDVEDNLLSLIPECCPALEELSMNKCSRITDSGLKFALSDLKELKLLWLHSLNPELNFCFFENVPNVYLKKLTFLSIHFNTFNNDIYGYFTDIVNNGDIEFVFCYLNNKTISCLRGV